MVSKGRLQQRLTKPAKQRPSHGPPRKSVMLVACCEGQTEVAYLKFAARRVGLRLQELDITTAGAPLTCATTARDKLKLCKAQGYIEVRAAAVFDRDEHPKIPDTMALCEQHGIVAVFSDPTIELWFLLHFQEQTGHIDRHQAKRDLKDHWAVYEKGDLPRDNFRILEHRQEVALERADALAAKHQGDGSPPNSNPPSTMGEYIIAAKELAALADPSGDSAK